MSEYDATSKLPSKAYDEGFDRIFRQKKQERAERSEERQKAINDAIEIVGDQGSGQHG